MSTRERTVRLIAVDKRYRANVYPSVPIKDDGMNTYLTGQHINPKDPSTAGNLTLAEMTHEVLLSAEKMQKFPFVIYPESRGHGGQVITTQFPLKHGDVFVLTQDGTGRAMNPRDAAMHTYCSYLYPTIAMSKKDVVPGETMFYMEDQAAEAEQRVAVDDLIFEAETLIRSSSLDKYRDLALLLNYHLKNFNINVSVLTETQVKDKMVQAAKEHPQAVIDCFAKGVEQDLFILRLQHRGIITVRNASFYDGNLFLGRTLEEVKAFIATNDHKDSVTKWGRLLENI